VVCGLYDQADEPGWGSYINVADVDEATSQAEHLGGSVIVEPFETPGGGRVATVRDPAGAVVSLSRPMPRTTFTMGDLLISGGHVPTPQEDPNPRWSVAFCVADADRAATQAQELGGSVLLPPMDIPIGRFTIVADPQGAVFTATAVPGGPTRGVDGS
jgi:uncharacterized protein